MGMASVHLSATILDCLSVYINNTKGKALTMFFLPRKGGGGVKTGKRQPIHLQHAIQTNKQKGARNRVAHLRKPLKDRSLPAFW